MLASKLISLNLAVSDWGFFAWVQGQLTSTDIKGVRLILPQPLRYGFYLKGSLLKTTTQGYGASLKAKAERAPIACPLLKLHGGGYS